MRGARRVLLAGTLSVVGVACASKPSADPGIGEVEATTVTKTVTLGGEPGEPCAYERTFSRSTLADGTTITGHSNYWNPSTVSVDLEEVGGIDGFFGAEREPGYSARAALGPVDVDGPVDRENLPTIDVETAELALSALRRWAANGEARVMIASGATSPGADLDRVLAALDALPRDGIVFITLSRGCIAQERYRAERAAQVFAPRR